MPPLLQSAQLKPDVIITSADSDNEIEESDDERYVDLSFWKVSLHICMKIRLIFCLVVFLGDY